MINILVGNIATGKSTYTKYNLYGSVVVNDDLITLAVHGNNYKEYNKKLKPLYKQIENDIIQYGITLGKNIIIDRPNNKADTRIRYIQLAKSLDYEEIRLIYFPSTSYKQCAERRFTSDNRGYSHDFWLKVAEERDNIEFTQEELKHYTETCTFEYLNKQDYRLIPGINLVEINGIFKPL